MVKYLGTTLANQNWIHEEIKGRLKPWITCNRSVQNILSSRPLPKNLGIKTHKTIILTVLLYGCDTWSLVLREVYVLRVS
jgi:hypothetical protein